VVALAALLTLGIASVADAHVLSKKRAAQATLEFEFAECVNRPDLYPGCLGAATLPCKRLTLHKVKCVGHIYGIFTDVTTGLQQPYDCERVYNWKIKPGKPAGKLFGKVGPQTCFADSGGHFRRSKPSGDREVLKEDVGDPGSGGTVTYP
jgi:hypothetical protein